ncbi:unnamed protein product [Hymenolepis diminuta]|uniref:ANK_REP_REGION domain-containing protein n=1 Tax=Hymenolepis diminuta TaxID=6216 RepID=A0A158QFA6_HYMDI|nr:unnamed protein product [Hymenolepis diminuta]
MYFSTQVLSNSQTENQPPTLLNKLKVRTDVDLADNSSTSDVVTPSTGCSVTPTVLNAPVETDSSDITKDVPTEVLLSNACTIGDCDEVVRILSFPEPPNVSQKYLYFAAKGGYADIAGMLLRAGAELDAKSPKSGNTPLLLACERGHTMVAKLLLQWGANPNATNNKFDTPLIVAIRGGHTAVVKYLLMFGVNPIPNPIPAIRPNTRYLLPIQVARNTQNTEVQNALFAANREMDKYMLQLVKSTMTPDVTLVNPGHPPVTKMSIAPQSASFIPVQIVSNSHSMTYQQLQLTFSTPPGYSDHFSRLANEANDPAMDELILLYVACVDLEEGKIIPPRCKQSMPIYTAASFNGSYNYALCIKPTKKSKTPSGGDATSKDSHEQPGFRIFILGNRLNNGGLNSITLYPDYSPQAVEFNKVRKILL